ncbi:PREDICTED: protein FAM83C-like [Nanorana parkeri]|uniref:protein FAM83C-like n=1 Tax=Nanorana parkeri TaxID=125878 RepID=UPI000854F414|nr:PREDICTED: protein FAM83C-like [Nanorana parkeri]
MLNPEVRRGVRSFGQLKSRVEELKNPWRQSSPLVLNYNESARLATDALVEQGEKAYLQTLTEEKELPFLSSLDIEYICSSMNVNNKSQDMLLDKDGDGVSDNCPSELTSGTYFPIMSDIDLPVLELGWPEIPLLTRSKGTEVQVIFQKHRNNNIKDLIRSLINKAKLVIAVVMDLFTDVDLLCDLIEAETKRRVPVYLLLDEINLKYFIEMFQKLGFDKINLPNMKIRTITGDTYCTKSGKKFSGQSLSKFLLIDCEHVIAGSYSFSWLSSQAHNNMVTYFKGNIVEEFDKEFRCLYACSLEADYFSSLENDNSKPFGQTPTRSRWMPIKTVPIPAPVIENSVHSDSNSSSDSQSSVKTPPFFKSQAITVIREDKPVISKYLTRNLHDTREETSKQPVDTVHNQRRQSNPHSDPQSDQNNLMLMQRQALSKSTPDLVDKPSSALRTKFEQIQNKFLHPPNKTSPRMKCDAALNKVSNYNSSSANSNVPLADIKREDASKRMTLGHSKLALITESNNKLLESKVYSRFQMRP